MDAAVTTLKFESKAVIPTDPRTKLFLTVTVSTIMITGGTGGFMNELCPSVSNGLPHHFFASFKEMDSSSQVYNYIRYFVCFGINGIAAAHWYMEFYPGSCGRDLYTHASRIYHGILSGEHYNCQ